MGGREHFFKVPQRDGMYFEVNIFCSALRTARAEVLKSYLLWEKKRKCPWFHLF